jgi:hypothetical protein
MATLAQIQAQIQAFIDQIIPKADFPAEKMNPLMQLITSVLFTGKKYIAVAMTNLGVETLGANVGYVNLTNVVNNFVIVLPENPSQFQTVQIFTSTSGGVTTELRVKDFELNTVYTDVSTSFDTLLFIYDGTNWVLQGFSRFVA